MALWGMAFSRYVSPALCFSNRHCPTERPRKWRSCFLVGVSSHCLSNLWDLYWDWDYVASWLKMHGLISVKLLKEKSCVYQLVSPLLEISVLSLGGVNEKIVCNEKRIAERQPTLTNKGKKNNQFLHHSASVSCR